MTIIFAVYEWNAKWRMHLWMQEVDKREIIQGSARVPHAYSTH